MKQWNIWFKHFVFLCRIALCRIECQTQCRIEVYILLRRCDGSIFLIGLQSADQWKIVRARISIALMNCWHVAPPGTCWQQHMSYVLTCWTTRNILSQSKSVRYILPSRLHYGCCILIDAPINRELPYSRTKWTFCQYIQRYNVYSDSVFNGTGSRVGQGQVGSQNSSHYSLAGLFFAGSFLEGCFFGWLLLGCSLDMLISSAAYALWQPCSVRPSLIKNIISIL